MASTTTSTKPYMLASSRKKVCCGRLVGCACHWSKLDIASASNSFGGNYSSSGNVTRFFSFRKCGQARCKIKCKDFNMLMPLNNFRVGLIKAVFQFLQMRILIVLART